MSTGRDRAQNWADWIELRRLLFEEELEESRKQKEGTQAPKLAPEDVSELLPDAIVHSSKQDTKLSKALAPIIEDSLDTSIKRDPQKIVDAIFPVIGPAIRKSIAETLKAMIQTINAALEHGFSSRSLKWRVEAMRTGKPFAEVALSHSLLFRVEQVFLIHRESGLLLQHVALDAVDVHDSDMISGMLTAIQDFVHDSFNREEGGSLETLQVGELSVWVEQGPRAILAGVIRGNAPQSVRSVFKETLETIHLEQREELEAYTGDSAPFRRSQPLMRSCLEVQTDEGGRKSSFRLWIMLGVLLAVLGAWWGVPALQSRWRWDDFINRVKAEPGIVVTSVAREDGKYVVSGLRDPLAANPDTIRARAQLDSAEIVYRWKPYQSLEREFVLARAKLLLNPPETVSLSLEDGVLIAKGWASHEWIMGAQRLVRVVSGVTRLQDDELVLHNLQGLIERIERQVFLFELGQSQILSVQEANLDDVARSITELDGKAQALGRKMYVEVIGQTDEVGSEEANMRISRGRAERVLSALIARGVATRNISATGIGSEGYTLAERQDRGGAYNRRVTFKVTLSSAKEGGADR